MMNEKKKIFCKEYLIDFNGTQAAIRAGYSKKSAEVQASRMIRDAKVQAYIYREKMKRLSKIDVDAAFVINGIKQIAVESRDENTRLKAFDMLGKHTGIYDKDNAQKAQAMTFKMNIQ